MLLTPGGIRSCAGSRPATCRRGSATLWMLGLLLALSAAMISIIEIYRLQSAKIEMQNAADAAALAAAGRMVDDRLLTGDANALADRIGSAGRQARAFALLNGVLGDAVDLDPNGGNDCSGDVVVGRLDPSKPLVFQGGDLTAASHSPGLLLNAVHIHACRTRLHGAGVCWRLARGLGVPSANVTAQATAMLDRDAIGFQPEGSRPIPLVPIALLSDPEGVNSGSWEHLVEKGAGPDEFSFDRERKAVQPGPDGLHEMALTFHGDRKKPENTRLLRLGVEQWSDMVEQVRRGATPDEMRRLPGGRLVLDMAGKAAVPSFPFPSDDDEAKSLFESLTFLKNAGDARVWPLFRGVDPAGGEVVLTGFVAARVVRAEQGKDGCYEVVVQPCMLATATTVTDASRRPVDRPTGNPYICKIRIVQ